MTNEILRIPDYHVNMIDQNSDQAPRAALELFHRAYRIFNSRADRILEDRGLGRSHHRILYFVGRNPGVAVNTLFGILGDLPWLVFKNTSKRLP